MTAQGRHIINATKQHFKNLPQSDYLFLFIIAAIYIIIISTLAISRHNSFDTNTWDLGIYSQSLYSTINHGKLLYYTAELPGNPSGSLFGIHFAPFLFLIAPIYALFQNPITLLVLRPVAISIGLVPLYWIIKNQQLNSRKLTFFLAAIYLVFPPITTPLSNFDLEVFLPALFLFAFYFFQKDKLVQSFGFVILALMVNEFVPLIVIAFAFYVTSVNHKKIIQILKTKKTSKHAIFALILLFTAILWFNVAGTVISGFNPTALDTKWEWGKLGSNPTEILVNTITNPPQTISILLNDGQNKLLYIASLFGPLAFLSFLEPLTLILTLPWLGASLLSINPLYYAIGTQYPAFVSPFIFVAAVNGIKKMLQYKNRFLLNKIIVLMVASLLVSFYLLPTGDYFSNTKSDESTRTALQFIPNDASVAAMPEICPHLSNRLQVYPYFKDGVDYILVDVNSWWYTVTLPKPAHTAPKWCDAQFSPDYGLVVNSNGVLLYKKGYTSPVKCFEGVNFSYDSNNVKLITGTVVTEKIPILNTTTEKNVLMLNSSSQNSTFFTAPLNVLPPGDYQINLLMKTSSTLNTASITLNGFNKQNQTLFTKQINGNNFSAANQWQDFFFTFKLNQPTFVKFNALVTNKAIVYFHSMTVSQISGSP